MKSQPFHIFMVRDEDEVRQIEARLRALDGIVSVHGDHRTKIFAIQWTEPASWELIEDTLSRMGYVVEHR